MSYCLQIGLTQPIMWGWKKPALKMEQSRELSHIHFGRMHNVTTLQNTTTPAEFPSMIQSELLFSMKLLNLFIKISNSYFQIYICIQNVLEFNHIIKSNTQNIIKSSQTLSIKKMKKDNLTNRKLFFSPTVEAGWQTQSHITDFKLEQKLGSGSFGTVSKAVHRKTGKVYAIKEIKKAALDSQKLLEHAKTEVKIMYKLNHPNIIKLYNHFEDEVSIFLVLQYAANGQLYNLLKSQPDKRFSQEVAALYIMQITQGIAQIHKNNIMHRDLKLQNILVDANNTMKIADFGWSHFLDAEQKRSTYCGTLDYLAPEMVEKGHKHDERVDIWSIGVLIYELCTGYSPFSCTLTGNDISIENVKKNIKNLIYKMPKQLTPQCQDLIRNLLKRSPQQRLTLSQILSHPWLSIIKKNDSYRKQNMNDNWLQSLSKQMKEMFPEETINTNNVSKDGKYFTTEELYKYTRPDSVINLKPKRKKDQVSPVFNKKIEESAITQATNASEISQKSSKIVGQTPSFLSNSNASTYQYKKLSALQLKVTQLQLQRKTDKQQIERLKTELIKNKQHTECKTQIKQLMEQILKQNKIMEQLNNKLNESERKVMIYERQKRGQIK